MSTNPPVPRRTEVIRAHKEAGGKVAAVFPVHQPRALFHAHGLLPVEVWGPPGTSPTQGDTHLQAYTCSIVRCGLSFLLSGGLEVADVVVVPHACDSLQGLGSLLIDLVPPDQPVLPIYMPRTADHPSGPRFLADELRALSSRLATVTGSRPSSAELHAAISREEAADALLARLHEDRPGLACSDRTFYQVVRAREYLPAQPWEELARSLLEQRGRDEQAVPLVLSGVVPEPMALLDAISEAGATVAADDTLCCGHRLYPSGDSEEPYERLAQRLLGAPPCSTRGSPIQQRIDHLLGLVERTGARGVLFHEVKFCEPEQFYLPYVREALDEAGIRSVVIEVDLSDPLPHQAITRLEALVETVR